MLGGAGRIFCFCEDTARVLREEMGIAEGRIFLLPHAINGFEGSGRDAPWDVCTKEKESELCVYVARLEERKGVRVLVEAWQRVAQEVPDARLVIVGSGVQAKHIDRMIALMKDDSVQRISRLPQADLERLVSSAQVAVCPSYLEGFGLAAAEAMMAGTAVIASDCDGLRSLIEHERTGLLVPAGDASSLAEAIVRFLRDDVLRDHLAEAALHAVRSRFDPAVAARAVVDAIVCCTIRS